MKILYLVNHKPEQEIQKLINEHDKENEVEVYDFASGKLSYEAIVDHIEQSDKVISWNNDEI